MTVSASIPAAVIAMGVLQGVLRRRSILESNMVQTSASAGESLAAGIIFTMPALVLTGIWEEFDFLTTTAIALAGGMLGVLLMVPMRRVFVVNNDELKYPEGVACAEVLRAGGDESDGVEKAAGATGAALVLGGVAVGAVFKFMSSFAGLIHGSVEWATLRTGRVLYFGMDISPALVSVGVIVGLPISVQIFLGGAIGWLIALPFFGAESIAAAESAIIIAREAEGLAVGGPVAAAEVATELWSTQIRYIGVGAMVVGGVISIWRVRGGLYSAFDELAKRFRPVSSDEEVPRTERDLSGLVIAVLAIFSIALIGGIYLSVLNGAIGLSLLILAIMLVMAFFFTAVASYIVGLVGNSNCPVSGMTITAVLGTALLIYLFGYTGDAAILATLAVAGVVCCVACTSGDVCNDLKTGHLVGASPRRQQIMQVLGVLVASLVMAPVLTVLHEGSIRAGTGGIGGEEMSAPQATLFKSLVEGFFGDGQLPWDMIGIGAAIGAGLLIADFLLTTAGIRFRLHVMPVAVGIYLPFELAVSILIGGLLHALISWRSGGSQSPPVKRGVLLASGLIAGESLVGVALGFVAYLGYGSLGLFDAAGGISGMVHFGARASAGVCFAGGAGAVDRLDLSGGHAAARCLTRNRSCDAMTGRSSQRRDAPSSCLIAPRCESVAESQFAAAILRAQKGRLPWQRSPPIFRSSRSTSTFWVRECTTSKRDRAIRFCFCTATRRRPTFGETSSRTSRHMPAASRRT